MFGVAALALAVISTALDFLYVHKEEEFVWLPTLVWAVMLWQIFLAWWWWVGAGSGGGLTKGDRDDVHEKLKRRAKREVKRKAAEERRRRRRAKAQQVWQDVAAALSPSTAVSSSVRVSQSSRDRSSSPRRRHPREEASFGEEEGSRAASLASRPSSVTLRCSTQESSGPRFMPGVLFGWYRNLRLAHIDAARLQAAERAERMRGIDGESGREEDAERNFGEERDGDEKRQSGDSDNELDSPRSFWWWGPLRRWRLQDSTTY